MICDDGRKNPRNITYEQAYNHALHLFENDRDKTNMWWMKKHKILGDKSPYEWVKEGRGRKLIKIMEKCE